MTKNHPKDIADRVVYVDDDKEYYTELTTESVYKKRVLCIDIGQKEGYYANEVPGLDGKKKMNDLINREWRKWLRFRDP